MKDALNIFCRQIRARSVEHRVAIEALQPISGQVVSVLASILRQELDSMIRVFFLLAQKDREYRNKLIEASVSGEWWFAQGTRKKITDGKMKELADSRQKWTRLVYDFCCSFIHLSSFHDHQNRDPLSQISQDEREAILKYLRKYHNGQPSNPSPTFDDIVALLPNVFDKIASNLRSYLEQIEKNEDLT